MWAYRHGGSLYTRTFTTDGVCTLRHGNEVTWAKPFKVDGSGSVTVAGGLKHELKSDGSLNIENHYTARKKNDETKN
ncbi:MAG: hypothetical protein NTY53_08670 [Kiritimatiellaeota bacterium]|nr:hypothetical protein [Kiritimatiellota bacterium]